MTIRVRMNFHMYAKRLRQLNGVRLRSFLEVKNDVEKLESMKTNVEMFGDAAGIRL